MTRTFRYVLIAGGAMMGVLLFLLASAAENTTFFEQHYPGLLAINLLAAAALLILVALMLRRLYRHHRRKRFGTRLMTRLVLLFSLMGVLPGTVIYIVSVQFVSRSIESWFDVHVETALDAGVKLGRDILENALSDLHAQAEQLSAELSMRPPAERLLILSRLQNTSKKLEASILTRNGRIIAASGLSGQHLLPSMPTPAMLRQAIETSRYLATEWRDDDPETPHANETTLKLRVIVPLSENSLTARKGEPLFLHLLQTVSPTLARDAEALRAAYSEYQVRSVSRSGLQKIYIVTLTLTLLLSVFVAVAFAFDIASRLTRPLHLLALGTKAIAEGNLSPQSATPSSADELGSLIQSFNSMTRQLSIAQQQTEESQSALESAKAYLELVLAHMSAGVIVLDADFKLVSCNEAVSRILRQDISVYVGDMLSQVGGIGSFLASITAAFSDMKAHTAAEGIGAEKHYWQKQIEIAVETSQSSQDITLLVRGSYLPVKGETGYIVVFDDVTEIVSAQRATAWGEVARRLAHEIKNPLTPIQLSAERIPLKLREKLDEPDRQFLDRSTQTIINQVTAMKCMVDDFRDYARAPQATLTPLEINSLVEDVVHLYAGNDMQDAITLHLTDVLPRIMGDATQLRQVIHNLLQNALDATDEILADTRPQIVIRTEKITYQDVVNTPCIAVRLSVTDNGPGFPQKILAQIFEPYSTTKERGTGLGLAVVKKIVDEHHGRIDVQNRIGTHGAAVSVLFLRLADEA